MLETIRFQESRMPGNPLVRFDEGRVGRTAWCRLLSYSTVKLWKAVMTENDIAKQIHTTLGPGLLESV
jgi:hypothetical protein